MKEIIDWLIGLEKQARDLYRALAEHFKADEKLSGFLQEAAADETWHFQVMDSAKAQLTEITVPSPLISIDQKLKKKIETPFKETMQKLERGNLTVEDVLDFIIKTEFSEWNKIFLYVVNTLKTDIKQFNYTAAKIQHHIGRIRNFLESYPYGEKKVNELLSLERVFDENILVVEDNEVIGVFMESLMEEEGNVDLAANGQVALEMLEKKYYKVIISDVDMPVLNGIEFYKAATKKYTDIKRRFMFISGFPEGETKAFFEEHKVPLLPKPSPIDTIIRHAIRIMHETHKI